MESHSILNELIQLDQSNCLLIAERTKTEFTYPLHRHPEFELNYVEHAEGAKRTVGDSVEIIGDYDLVLITGKDLEHVWENHECKSPKIREITIQFSHDLFFDSFINKSQFRSIRLMLEKAQKGIKFPLDTILTVRPLLNSLSHDDKGFYSVMNFLTLLYELSLSEGAQTLSSNAFAKVGTTANSRRIQKTYDFVENNYSEKIHLSQVAELAGMSEVSFSRFFRNRTGKSFTDYLLDVRVGHSTRKLVDSTKSITEISFECGFNNISNFNRIFKKRKGCSPKEFRDTYNKRKFSI